MRADNNSGADAEAAVLCCASCGIAELDDIKLKPCDGCDLVAYCSDKCQANHQPDHEAACKERAAELRDDLLFKQPEGSHFGTARSAVFLCRLINKSLSRIHAAAK